MFNNKYLILFVCTAAIAILSQWLSIVVRFGQPTTIENYNFLNNGFLLLLILIVLSWLFFPYKVLVFSIGITALIFPSVFKGDVYPFIYTYTSKSELMILIIFYLLPIFLLVLATEFRSRMILRKT